MTLLPGRSGEPTTLLSKILLSVVVVGTASAVSGLGTYGSFTSGTSVDDVLASGSVVVRLGADGTSANRIPVAFDGVVPGDTVQRAATLSNTGDQDLGGITLTTSASDPSDLTADTHHGLRFTVEACSEAWAETGTAPAYSYTCPGTTSVVLRDRPVIGEDIPLPGLSSTTPSGTDHLRLVVGLPAGAGNAFQDLTSTVNFTFTATQRPATDR